MMLPSHLVVGLVFCSPLYLYAPAEAKLLTLLGILIGSIAPDADILFGQHRRTTHYPELSAVVALGLVVLTVPLPILFPVTAFTVGFSIHSWIDILGGGLEDKPWERTSQKSVYRHATKTWSPPRHYTGHDGSVRDLGITMVFTGIAISLYAYHWLTLLLFVNLGVALIYTTVRKYLPALRDKIIKKIPQLEPILRQV